MAGDATMQVANDFLPTRTEGMTNYDSGNTGGGVTFATDTAGDTMTITQQGAVSVVEWKNFSVGANAEVYFKGPSEFTSVNYVTGSEFSQIYGYINASDSGNGNIYLMNPNGVTIGNSGEFVGGSLLVSNREMDDTFLGNLKAAGSKDAVDTAFRNQGATGIQNTDLMSLGHIVANEITFEGERIVLDVDNVKKPGVEELPEIYVGSHNDGLNNGTDTYMSYDIVLGMMDTTKNISKIHVYDVGEGFKLNATAATTDSKSTANSYNMNAATHEEGTSNISNKEFYKYKWIRTGEELMDVARQTVTDDEYTAYTKTVASGETALEKDAYATQVYKEKMAGHYALRYAIDLTDDIWTPIGTYDNPFTGKLDGVNNNIYGLTYSDATKDYVGLFGVTKNAAIGYFNLISANESWDIQGKNYVGSLIGYAINTKVEDVETTFRVKGNEYVGGLIGKMEYNEDDAKHGERSFLINAVNMNHIQGHAYVGGLVGYMDGGELGVGEEQEDEYSATHNLGKVQGINNETAVYTDETTIDTTNSPVDADGNIINPEIYYSHDVGGLVGLAKNKAVIGGIKTYDLNEITTAEEAAAFTQRTGITVRTGTILNTDGSVKETYYYYESTPTVDTTGVATLYNTAEISGGYNVGGIVGHGMNVVVANVRNESGIEANGYTTKYPYIFQTDYTDEKGLVGTANQYQWDTRTDKNKATGDGTRIVSIRAGNAGGIVGNMESSEYGSFEQVTGEQAMNQSVAYIQDAENRGNVTASLVKGDTENKGNTTVDYYDHYMSGNIGGITGRAKDTNMVNVLNTEADVEGANNEAKITGANNVGGITGYFGQTMQQAATGKDFRISNAKNDGGEVLATGGVHGDLNNGNKVFLTEIIRSDYKNNKSEKYIIGNAGGIVGYMRGTLTHVDSSANRGDVHSQSYTDVTAIPMTAQAANMGGIIGKLDRTIPTSIYTWAENNFLDLIKYDKTKVTKAGSTDTIEVTVGPSGVTGEDAATVASVYNTGHVLSLIHI